MQVHLSNPTLERFIAEEIRAGNYPSAEAAVEAAVERMMLETKDDLDDGTVAAINRAEDELAAGKGIDFETFRAGFLERHGKL
ncbi:MAG: hypothetical protein H7144_14820 [Burkholderiales bacterium]|nr:hypothetical protein [Phycisphaerae bacterium]